MVRMEVRGGSGTCSRWSLEQDAGAEGGYPEAPAGAAEKAGEVPDGKSGDGGGEDVALVEQVDAAGDEADGADPSGKNSAAQDHDADSGGPSDHQQLAQMLAQQRPAELVLCGPGSGHRSPRLPVPCRVAACQCRHDKHPAQEPDE